VEHTADVAFIKRVKKVLPRIAILMTAEYQLTVWCLAEVYDRKGFKL
jgi:hypothetical protein